MESNCPLRQWDGQKGSQRSLLQWRCLRMKREKSGYYENQPNDLEIYASFSLTARKSPLNIRSLTIHEMLGMRCLAKSQGLPRQAVLLLLSFIRRQSRMGRTLLEAFWDTDDYKAKVTSG
ncbi:hypothetical protein CEXT_28371 [Caerostris extrusa]|uniref:Uncharacterized protein n=1 Tax=Caerostris extrusa TaxID=172846 RepID=A0AAV4TJ67_CAEEX|nr:hypothetical protein CEXT_28371 [Caerostris extrusa]